MNRKRFLLLTCAVAFCFATKAQDNSITETKYWIDHQIGNWQTLTESPAEIDLSDYSYGVHAITACSKDGNGVWSCPVTQFFLLTPTVPSATSVVQQEYWIDHQIDSRQTLTTSPAEIDLSNYSYGVHAITAWSKDDLGVWSCPVTQYFVITSTVTSATSIEQREYWIDGNVNGRVSLPDAIALIDLSAYSDGLHSITVRVKDDKGIWSSPVTQFFVIMSETPTTTMTSYCYWFDDNSANAVNSKLPAASGLMDIDVSGLSYYTEHTLHLAVCDSKGAYSMVMEEIFIIEPITTGIESLNGQRDSVKGQREDWFSLDGKKLNGRPTQKGIYIRNGRKVILK